MLKVVARAWLMRGFALLEAIVAITMLAILAAAIVPLIAGAVDRARAEATVRELKHLKSAIDKFRVRVGVYPSQLIHTAEPIAPGNKDSCQSNYGTTGRDRWGDNDVSYGPWFRDHMIVDAVGFPTAVGFVSDVMTRSGADLIISITDVAEAQALDLDLLIDGGGGAVLGEIRWGAVADGVTTVQYTLNRPGC